MLNIKKLLSSSLLFIISLIVYNLFTKLYPELLWFESFNADGIWWFTLLSKLKVFAIFFIISFIFIYANFKIARHICNTTTANPKTDFNTPFPALNQLLAELAQRSTQNTMNQLPKQAVNVIGIIAVTGLSILLGLGAKSWWLTLYSYLNQSSFSIIEPIFNRDIGFYFFTLPILENIQSWFFTLTFFTILLTGWLYFSKNILLIISVKNLQKQRLKNTFLYY